MLMSLGQRIEGNWRTDEMLFEMRFEIEQSWRASDSMADRDRCSPSVAALESEFLINELVN